jgi:hypothetical protein
MAELSQSTMKVSHIAKRLPNNFRLAENDVYVGRSGLYRHHIGNKRFNDIVLTNLDRYCNVSTRNEKTTLIYEIIDQVRANSPNGGFVKRNNKTGQWYEVGDAVAVSISKCPANTLLF